jgi:hypothetical protein
MVVCVSGWTLTGPCCYTLKSNHVNLNSRSNIFKKSVINADYKIFVSTECNENDLPTSIVRYTWTARLQQLIEYKNRTGNTLVPKRYKENPALGNWVNKQRQNYRKFVLNQPTSLTKRQVDILNELQFCWVATRIDRSALSWRSINDWWAQLEDLRRAAYPKLALVPPQSPHGTWIQRQREMYVGSRAHGASMECTLQPDQVEALNSLDPEWYLTRRQLLWERRYRELVEYKAGNGNCCVPISYANKQLANWVSHQRKQYNLMQRSKPSYMTTDRLHRLNSIGFVWNRWDDRFAKQLAPDVHQY